MKATNILLLLLAIATTQISYSTTYFIATDGDDTDVGTVIDPLATFAEAAARVVPGDTVWVRDGTYHERVMLTTSGTFANPIVWNVFPQEGVTINGLSRPINTLDPSSERPQWEFFNCNWQEVYGFKIVNSPSYGVSDAWGSSKNNRIEGVIVLDCHESGFKLIGNKYTMRDCQSNYNFDYAGNETLYGTSNVAGSNADGFTFEGKQNNIYHCSAFGNSDDGFDFYGGNENILTECIAYKSGSENGARDRDKSAYTALPFAGNGTGFLMGRGTSSYQAFNTVVRCLSFQNPNAGFDQGGGGGNKFHNCTSYSNTVNFYSYDHPSNSGVLETIYRNNLSHDGLIDIQGTSDMLHNSWDGTISVVVTDADFVNLSSSSGNFLKLQYGSDCIDAGIDIGLSYESIAPDLGYHERLESTPPLAIDDVSIAFANWNLYPIPATSSVFIDLSELGFEEFTTAEISLVDLTGRSISRLQPAAVLEELSLESLSPGMYIVRLTVGDASDSRRILVE